MDAGDDETVEERVAAAMLREAELHEAGRVDEIGDRYDDVYAEIVPIMEGQNATVGLAFDFWDGWVDAANHDWQYYGGIVRDDWPKFAREIADALRQGVEVTNPVLVARFAPRPRRSMRRWFTDFIKRPARQR